MRASSDARVSLPHSSPVQVVTFGEAQNFLPMAGDALADVEQLRGLWQRPVDSADAFAAACDLVAALGGKWIERPIRNARPM